jgi:putative FmdB family regulatory protein
MPTYEYECAKCRKTFDLVQSIKAEPLTKCPTCKGKIKRLVGTGAGILFKGSGFYQTDYRSEGYKQKAKADTAPSTPAPATSTPTPAPAGTAAPPKESAKPAAKPAATSEKK